MDRLEQSLQITKNIYNSFTNFLGINNNSNAGLKSVQITKIEENDSEESPVLLPKPTPKSKLAQLVSEKLSGDN